MTILLADDQPVALAGLRALLAPAGLRIDTTAAPEAALDAVEQERPRLAISGFFLRDQGRTALAFVQALAARWPGLPVLVRAPHDDPHLRIGLHQLGARGLIGTDAQLEHIMAAVDRLLTGGTCFSPIPRGTPLLTSRDLTILQGLAGGRSHQDVAAQLQTSRTAVDTRLHILRRRFEVPGTMGLIALMVEGGLAHLPPETLGGVVDNGAPGGWADGRIR